MDERFNVAVVGATGAVGETMLEILAQREFPVGEVYALASARSAGKSVSFGSRRLTVTDLDEFDFSKAQIGLFSAGCLGIGSPRAQGRRGGLRGHRQHLQIPL